MIKALQMSSANILLAKRTFVQWNIFPTFFDKN